MRLRLARLRDREAVHGLLDRLGLVADDLDVRRLVRCTPGRCLTVAALAWEDGHERLAGVGSLAVGPGELTLLADDPAVAELLAEALRGHAQTWARRVA